MELLGDQLQIRGLVGATLRPGKNVIDMKVRRQFLADRLLDRLTYRLIRFRFAHRLFLFSLARNRRLCGELRLSPRDVCCLP
jgi:hypothetical protein